eukprot:87755-Prorocentrum_minimum.AAC.1
MDPGGRSVAGGLIVGLTTHRQGDSTTRMSAAVTAASPLQAIGAKKTEPAHQNIIGIRGHDQAAAKGLNTNGAHAMNLSASRTCPARCICAVIDARVPALDPMYL